MSKPTKRRPVMGPCPSPEGSSRTHAVMTPRELRRFRGALVYWCDCCRVAHRADAQDLQLVRSDTIVAAMAEIAQIDPLLA